MLWRNLSQKKNRAEISNGNGSDIKKSTKKSDMKDSDGNSVIAKAKALNVSQRCIQLYIFDDKVSWQANLWQNSDCKKSNNRTNEIYWLTQNKFQVTLKKINHVLPLVGCNKIMISDGLLKISKVYYII